jgi:hypothetical protein
MTKTEITQALTTRYQDLQAIAYAAGDGRTQDAINDALQALRVAIKESSFADPRQRL